MNQSLFEVIKKRKSVRSFTERKIEVKKKAELQSEMTRLSNDLFRFEFVDYTTDGNEKVASYGVVKGAKTFMIGIMKKSKSLDRDLALDFGYAFEELVLKATKLNLGTCWMASGFKNKNIGNIDSSEDIVIISPLGYSANKKRLIEKIGAAAMKSGKRKPWQDLFYLNDHKTPLNEQDAGEYKELLEAVRIAPSAINLQPWRIIKTPESVDFYTVKSKSADKNGQKINYTLVDIGISKCHFDLLAKEKGITGKWVNKNITSNELDYVLSFVKT